ncbi:hypothetical protein P4W20_27140, partial [Bacillus thuringiensis]|nr:hypothetical protein [Bacillus thuringiensis]
ICRLLKFIKKSNFFLEKIALFVPFYKSMHYMCKNIETFSLFKNMHVKTEQPRLERQEFAFIKLFKSI